MPPCSMGRFSVASSGSTDNFPFAAFAADALEADVIQKVKQLLEVEE